MLSRTILSLRTHTNVDGQNAHKYTPHSDGISYYAHWGTGNENDTVTCMAPVASWKKGATEAQVLLACLQPLFKQ